MNAVFVIAQTAGSWVWGTLADRYGNHTVTIASASGLALQAATYWLSPSLYYLVLEQAVGGFCFAGFLLGTFNAVIGIGDKRQKTLVVAGFHFVGNMAGFVAPFFGTWIYSGPGLVLSFLVAGFLRMFSVLLFAKGTPIERKGLGLGPPPAALSRSRRRQRVTGQVGTRL